MKILVADDHRLIIEGYKSTFKKSQIEEAHYAYDCDTTLELLASNNFKYDIVILDEIMPSTNKTIKSGSQIAKLIKTQNEDTKIILITSMMESIKLYDLIQSINPDGFISKNNCTPEELLNAITTIRKNSIYYSHDIKSALNKVKSNTLYLDNINRQILFLLAQGVMTKNLVDYLPLSASAIQKRKSYIKLFFNVEKENDEQLLKSAREQGFL